MPPKTPLPGDEQRKVAIGARIREARLQRGLSIRQMASAVGMSAGWVANVESGANGIDAIRLGDVARLLEVPVGFLLDTSADDATRKPATRLDWELMFSGQDERARAHFELDEVFKRLERERAPDDGKT